MRYWRGLIITGVSAAGKTTLSRALSARHPSFEQVRAVTTRAPRADDEPGWFAYLTEDQFDAMDGDRGSLLVRAVYRGRRYGITRQHLAEVEARGKAPILPLTPRSLADFLAEHKPVAETFLALFVDAPDEVLDGRLGLRSQDGQPARDDVLRQREEDRRHRGLCHRVLAENVDLERSLALVLDWWRAGIECR